MDKLVDLIIRESDIPRPIIRAPVVGNAYWSSTAPSSAVDVMIQGQRRRVKYSDGRLPLIGEHVEVQRMNHLPTSDWFAQPLTEPAANCAGDLEFYFRVNGRLTEPPTELPSSGLAGKTVTVTISLDGTCLDVYVRLFTRRNDAFGNHIQNFDLDQEGPINIASTLVLTAVVPLDNYSVAFQTRQGPFNSWPNYPPLTYDIGDEV